MSRTLRRLIPSPAMIVALVALVVALGSSAYAQRFVPAITGGDIANNSVTGADIRNTSLTRKDIRKRSLRGRKFELNSVGGRAIKESALETVPSARRAGGLDFWAIVGRNGVVQGGRGVVRGNPPPSAVRTSAAKPATVRRAVADQVVTFTRDVSKCSVLATIGSSNSSFPANYGQIMVAHVNGSPNAVKVRTEVMPFQVGVIC